METMVEKNDISHCIGKKVCDEMKFKLLTTPWKPDENYKFLISKID